jgi:hypothetical protein
MKFSEVTALAIALAEWRQTDRPAADVSAAGSPPPDGPPTLEPDALRRFLGELPPATIYLLAAVAYLGASDDGPGRLIDLLLRLGRHFPTGRRWWTCRPTARWPGAWPTACGSCPPHG